MTDLIDTLKKSFRISKKEALIILVLTPWITLLLEWLASIWMQKLGLTPPSIASFQVTSLKLLPELIFYKALIPSIIEELFFRGLVTAILLKYLSSISTTLIVALVFAVAHHSFSLLPFYFLLGLYLGGMRLKTKSVTGGMIAHFLNNLIALITTL